MPRAGASPYLDPVKPLLLAAALVAGAGCRTTLRELLPLEGTPLPLRAGFYAVEPVNGHNPFGDLVFLCPKEFVHTNLCGTAVRRYAGIRGAFYPDGAISTRFDGERSAYVWRAGESGEREFFIDEAGPDHLQVRFGGAPGTPGARLRYAGRRPGRDRNKTVHLAHRGSYLFDIPNYNGEAIHPANTIPAFQEAIDTGYEGFELDLRLTRDGKFAVSHDEDLSVATDLEGKVCERTLDEIRRGLVLGSPVMPEAGLTVIKAYFAAPVPGLREVLERFLPDERVRFIVLDVKPDDPGRIRAGMAEALDGFRTDLLDKLIFAVRTPEEILLLRGLAPNARFAHEGPTGTEPLDGDPPPPGATTVSLNMGLLLAFPLSTVNIPRVARVLRDAEASGRDVMGWTVSDALEFEMIRVHRLHADFLLGDAPYTQIAREILRELNGR